jgi:hypothetical protein
MPDQDRPRVKPALYKATEARYLNVEDLKKLDRDGKVQWIDDKPLFVPGYQVRRLLRRRVVRSLSQHHTHSHCVVPRGLVVTWSRATTCHEHGVAAACRSSTHHDPLPRWLLVMLQESLSNIWFFSSKLLPLYSVDYRRGVYGIPPLAEGTVVLPAGGKKQKMCVADRSYTPPSCSSSLALL